MKSLNVLRLEGLLMAIEGLEKKYRKRAEKREDEAWRVMCRHVIDGFRESARQISMLIAEEEGETETRDEGGG